ncbi:hypothetical protein OIU84_007877 [Salix udensis]|uniref:Uncharacterized protein n=1 Tax=Salix udensis TaxID=889485 RepID=A0AAD6JTU0_9ROSI|nr:hypothetical protein OIU84_007877 [Salix udensis]
MTSPADFDQFDYNDDDDDDDDNSLDNAQWCVLSPFGFSIPQRFSSLGFSTTVSKEFLAEHRHGLLRELREGHPGKHHNSQFLVQKPQYFPPLCENYGKDTHILLLIQNLVGMVKKNLMRQTMVLNLLTQFFHGAQYLMQFALTPELFLSREMVLAVMARILSSLFKNLGHPSFHDL